MIKFSLHVFTGCFPSQEHATNYTEWRYDEATEDRSSDFSMDFAGLEFDEDFLEVIFGTGAEDYVKSMLFDEAEMQSIQSRQHPEDNTFILLMELGGNKGIKIPSSTVQTVRYCGRFRGVFRDPEPKPPK